MSRSTTTTEEFDTEGNLLKKTVEVWEDEPTIELDVAEEPEDESPGVARQVFPYGPNGGHPFVGTIKLDGKDIVGVVPWFKTHERYYNLPLDVYTAPRNYPISS